MEDQKLSFSNKTRNGIYLPRTNFASEHKPKKSFPNISCYQCVLHGHMVENNRTVS